MKSDQTNKQQPTVPDGHHDGSCVAGLDRLILNAVARGKHGIQNVPGYERVSDFIPHRQGKIATYGRLRKLRSIEDSSKIDVQYKPRVPWVSPLRVTMIGDDETGLTLEQIESVTRQCQRHTFSLVELAFDFAPSAGVDRGFVLRHGRFGKSRRRLDRGGPGSLRYGGRECPKLVRCYFKPVLDCFRVELEIHGLMLKKHGVREIFDLGKIAAALVPAHLKFVVFRWKKLEAYLGRKFGQDGAAIYEETRRKAGCSLRAATRHLKKNGVANPHRFLGSLQINRHVRKALGHWAEEFTDQWC